MKTVRCTHCGNEYVPRKPESAIRSLLSERRFFDVAPELHDRAACPACGHQQENAQYLFFGFLSARGVQIVIGLILFAMLMLGLVFKR